MDIQGPKILFLSRDSCQYPVRRLADIEMRQVNERRTDSLHPWNKILRYFWSFFYYQKVEKLLIVYMGRGIYILRKRYLANWRK